MVQQVKSLTSKPDNQSSIFGTHTITVENYSLTSIWKLCCMYTCTHTHTQNKIFLNFKRQLSHKYTLHYKSQNWFLFMRCDYNIINKEILRLECQDTNPTVTPHQLSTENNKYYISFILKQNWRNYIKKAKY